MCRQGIFTYQKWLQWLLLMIKVYAANGRGGGYPALAESSSSLMPEANRHWIKECSGKVWNIDGLWFRPYGSMNGIKTKRKISFIGKGGWYFTWQGSITGIRTRIVILTTAVNDSMKPVHDRMHLLLEQDEIEKWLKENQ